MTKPVSPAEALELKTQLLPSVVFEVVNELIARNIDAEGRSARFNNNELKAAFAKRGYSNWNNVVECGYLGFVPAYKQQGWNVEVDKPGYNETYPTTWTFRNASVR